MPTPPRRKRRPASHLGPSLNPNNANLGAKVRVTGGTILQGAHGVIIGAANSGRPLVRFESGSEKSLPVNRFQLILGTQGADEVLTSPEGHWYFPPVPKAEKTVGLECRACGQTYLCLEDATAHVLAGCNGSEKPKKSDKKLRRTDAEWDF